MVQQATTKQKPNQESSTHLEEAFDRALGEKIEFPKVDRAAEPKARSPLVAKFPAKLDGAHIVQDVVSPEHPTTRIVHIRQVHIGSHLNSFKALLSQKQVAGPMLFTKEDKAQLEASVDSFAKIAEYAQKGVGEVLTSIHRHVGRTQVYDEGLPIDATAEELRQDRTVSSPEATAKALATHRAQWDRDWDLVIQASTAMKGRDLPPQNLKALLQPIANTAKSIDEAMFRGNPTYSGPHQLLKMFPDSELLPSETRGSNETRGLMFLRGMQSGDAKLVEAANEYGEAVILRIVEGTERTDDGLAVVLLGAEHALGDTIVRWNTRFPKQQIALTEVTPLNVAQILEALKGKAK